MTKSNRPNPEEEKELLEKYQKHNDIDARNKLIEANMPYVIKKFNKFAEKSPENYRDGLLQLTHDICLHAAETITPGEIRFITKVGIMLNQALPTYKPDTDTNESPVIDFEDLPRKKANRFLDKVVLSMLNKQGLVNPQNIEGIVESTGGKPYKFDLEFIRLDEESQFTSESPEAIYERKELDYERKELEELYINLIEQLPEREREIIINYFGLSEEQLTPKELMTKYNISRQTIYTIKDKILEKLQKSYNESLSETSANEPLSETSAYRAALERQKIDPIKLETKDTYKKPIPEQKKDKPKPVIRRKSKSKTDPFEAWKPSEDNYCFTTIERTPPPRINQEAAQRVIEPLNNENINQNNSPIKSSMNVVKQLYLNILKLIKNHEK